MENLTKEDIFKKEQVLEQQFVEICGPIDCGDYDNYDAFLEAIKDEVNFKNAEINDYINVEAYAKDWWEDFWYDYQHDYVDMNEETKEIVE